MKKLISVLILPLALAAALAACSARTERSVWHDQHEPSQMQGVFPPAETAPTE